MVTGRHEKQSESLEVRLGFDAKRAFMEACREKGMTASEVVRHFVETYPVSPVRRPWARLPTQLTEYPMTLTLTALLATSLAASTLLPLQPAAANREDPQNSFARLDADGDGYFNRVDLYHAAGLTDDGRLGEGLRSEAMGSITEAMAQFGPSLQEDMLDPEFVEGVMESAESGARSGVDQAFTDLDTDQDDRVSLAEFLAARQ
ncbi:hypothetical protein [Maricaulis salignorans]|uniref:hypothetical protein n=1 Tax=Maricaulis salignorans TaxID=144026 RepID=UPI003A904D1F